MPNTETNNNESLQVMSKENNTTPFVIDFFNRLIRPIRGVNIATSTSKFLKLRPEFLPSGVIECDITNTTVTGTLGETTLNSYTVPLNTMSRNMGNTSATSGRDFRKAGNTFKIWASGVYTTDDATATVTITLKMGSTTCHSIVTTGATVANAPWSINWVFMVSTLGSSATAESYAEAKTNNVNKDSGSTATIGFSTIADQAIAVTATWSSGSAGDSITIRQFMVELVN